MIESRRRFLGQVAGIGFLSCLAGCTAVGTVEIDIVMENRGVQGEQIEFYIDREETTTEVETIDLEEGDEQTVSVEIERGDSIIISSGDSGRECVLENYICRSPTLNVGVGFDTFAIGGECFEFHTYTE